MCRPGLEFAAAGPGGLVPVIVMRDMSSRLPAQRLPAEALDTISCIPLDRWDANAIPESNLSGRCATATSAKVCSPCLESHRMLTGNS